MSTPLSNHDSAIWRTIRINDLIDAGRFGEVETVMTSFPPSLGRGERVVATGGITINEFLPLGDGSYVHNNGVFFATGRYGLALTAGVAAGRAIGNASRRAAAAAAAVPRWRPVDHGSIYVSDWGFYLFSNLGLRAWAWPYVTSLQLIGPRTALLNGTTSGGAVQWVVESDWTELLFTLWARARHPQHPQFVGGTWVPPGWADRLQASPYDAPPSLSGRWTHMLPSGGS